MYTKDCRTVGYNVWQTTLYPTREIEDSHLKLLKLYSSTAEKYIIILQSNEQQ